MKKIVLCIIASLLVGYYSFSQELEPYIKVGDVTESIESVSTKVESILKTASKFIK